MASPSTVITLGYGSFGGVGLLPTLGFGIGSVAAITGPLDGWTSPIQLLDYTAGPSLIDWTATPLLADWTSE